MGLTGTAHGARRALLASMVAALVVAGCSSGDDDEGAGSGDGAAADEAGTDGTASEGAAATPSAGCEGPATGQADLEEATLDVRGEQRRFLVSAPAWEEGDDPLPVVLDFHGLAEGADVHAQMTQMGPLGIEEGFVTVFPHGRGNPVAWDVSPDPAANADLAFVEAILAHVEDERCVDVSRIYATGLSNGAMMTSAVGCAMADRVAAIAPVAGIALPEPCAPARPLPVLTMHGTADPILLFNGGIDGSALGSALGGGDGDDTTTTTRPPADLDGPGYPETVGQWAGLAGCETTPDDERVSDEVVRRTYDCPDESPVEFLIVEGGGHSWPGSEFSRSIEEIVGHTTTDIDASREVWEFVRRFSLPAD